LAEQEKLPLRIPRYQSLRRFGLRVDQAWHPGRDALLQQHLPEEFTDTAVWTDIFSDTRLYQTDTATAPLT